MSAVEPDAFGVGGIMVTAIVPLKPPACTPTRAVPTPTAAARPVIGLTVRTASLDEVQVCAEIERKRVERPATAHPQLVIRRWGRHGVAVCVHVRIVGTCADRSGRRHTTP